MVQTIIKFDDCLQDMANKAIGEVEKLAVEYFSDLEKDEIKGVELFEIVDDDELRDIVEKVVEEQEGLDIKGLWYLYWDTFMDVFEDNIETDTIGDGKNVIYMYLEQVVLGWYEEKEWVTLGGNI